MSEPSPLAEADPMSLDELFNRTPPLSEEDLDKIIAELKAQRERFLKADQEGKRPPRQPKAPKAKAPDVSLEDLGL